MCVSTLKHLLRIMGIACALAMPLTCYAKHSSSSSSSSSSSEVITIGQHVPGRVITYSIIDLLATVPREDLIRIFKATEKFVNCDFAKIWGTGATFRVFPRGYIPSTEETVDTVNVYFADTFSDPIGVHYQVIEGVTEQPQALIPVVSLVPQGKLVILISLIGNLGQTLDETINNLSVTFSHEVMETAGNPFNAIGNVPYDNIKFNLPYNDNTTFDGFVQEICDPVEFGATAEKCGLKMSNFVTPDFFNPFAPQGTRLDYLGLVKYPLKPYSGLIPVYTISCDNPPLHGIDISFPDDPDTVYRYSGSPNINCAPGEGSEIAGKLPEEMPKAIRNKIAQLPFRSKR